MKIFLAIPLNHPAKYLMRDMKACGLEPILCRSRNMAEAKRLILEADVIGHFTHNTDEMVRLQLEYARANDKEVLDFAWLKKNIKP